MMYYIFSIIFLILNINSLDAAYCGGKPHPNIDNNNPIYTEDPVFVASVKNGKLYQVGRKDLNNTLYIIHLWGTNYQRGQAQGQLLRNELKSFISELYAYIEDQFKEAVPSWVPDWLASRISAFGVGTALDMTYYAT